MSTIYREIEFEDFSDMEELDELDDDKCESCPMYDLCVENGVGDEPNQSACFMTTDDDVFYASDDEREEHSWREMGYNKFKEKSWD